MGEKVLKIDPMGKPRMVKSDAWKKRPAVERYWGYKKHLVLLANKAKVDLSSGMLSVRFNIPMPPSWSKKKLAEKTGA